MGPAQPYDDGIFNIAPQVDDCNSVVKNCDTFLDIMQKLTTDNAIQGDKNAFFVMHMERIRGIIGNWHLKMPNVKPFYSMRCNSDRVLLQCITENTDVGLCCSSRFELELALKFVSKNSIIYANPMWSRANIRHAKEYGIQTIVIESEDDLNRFATYYPESSLILRVTMDPSLVNVPLTIDNVDIDKAIDLLHKAKNMTVNVTGISFSVRSNSPSAMIFAYAVAQCRRIFDIGHEIGHKMNILNLGSGFPSPFTTDGLTFDRIAGTLRAALSLFFPQTHFDYLKLIAEPGAYFAASAYSLLTRIVDKSMVSANVLTNDEMDAGSVGYVYQISEGFYGAFGCRLLTYRNPNCTPLINFGERMNTFATVVGPELGDADVILSLTKLPPLQIGDWLIWHDMGAYTMSNSETLDKDGLPRVPIYYNNDEKARIAFPNFLASSLLTKRITDLSVESDVSLDEEISNNPEPEPNSSIDRAGIVAEQIKGAAA